MRHVFVSSTSKGMEAVRADVIHAIQLADGFEPVNMENFGLRADVPLTVCRDKVRASAVFLGVIGHDYGSCPPNSDVSYTRHEYHEALAQGLPRLMFVTPDQADGIELDPRQAAFRAQVLADGLAVMIRQGETHEFGKFTAAGLHNLPPETLDPVAPRLPPAPRIFGREQEIGRIVAALTVPVTNPLPIAILGHAGIGKTTVTLGVLHDPAIRQRYGAHRCFAALETAADAETMRIAIVVACGLDPRSARFPHALAYLAEVAPALLVLDNLETPVAADPRAVEGDLLSLAQVEGLALVVSRRGTERPGGPDWMTLDPLPPLSAEASSELFLRWAPRISPNDPNLAPLLAELGGLALAIALTARQAAAHPTLAGTMRDWRRKGAELAARPDIPRDAQGRLDALTVSLSLSTDRLGEDGKRLFALLGRTPAGMAEDDIATLLGDDATEAMRQLRVAGLAEEAPGRLDLLPPVRGHARRTTSIAAADATWFHHYLALADDLGSRVGRDGGAEAIERLIPELSNIDAAIDAAVDGETLELAVAARYGLSTTIRFSGLGSPRTLESLAAACSSAGDASGEARCLEGLGDIALARSDHDAARSRYEAALPLYRRVGDVVGEANCIRSLGDIALRRSDHDAARSRYEEALPLYRRVGAVLGEANCIMSLGDIALERSDHDAARSRYEAALPLYRRVGAVLGEANCIKSLGDIALARSDHDAARSRYEAALPLYRRVGDVLGEGNCIISLGEIALARSDHDAARSRYEAALPLYRRVGAVLGEANCIMSLGDIALRRSDHDAARSRYEAALPLYRRVGSVLGEANCIRSLGDIALARSDHDAARSRYEAALPLYRRVGDVLGEANCIKSLGNIALARSDHDAARSRYEAALPLYRRAGDVVGEANCIRSLGDIALARSDHDAARSRYEAALPLYRRVGAVVGEGNCALALGRVAEVLGDRETARHRYEEALALYERVHHMHNVAIAHTDLVNVTTGAKRDAHLRAAQETWLAVGLPDQAASVKRRFSS